MKNIKLDCTMKYILTLLIILVIIYITYYFYNKNNYEHLTSIATTSKNSIDVRFRFKNIGTQKFNLNIYTLSYDSNTKKLVTVYKDRVNRLSQGELYETKNITSGNIGYFIRLTPNTNLDSDPEKNMDIEITSCINKGSNTFNQCESKLGLLTSEDVDTNINNMVVADSNPSSNFNISETSMGSKTTFRIKTKNKIKKYGIAFYIKE